MNSDISRAKSPELRGSLAAVKRAARLARQTAIQTETALVVRKNGKLIEIPPDQLRENTQAEKDR